MDVKLNSLKAHISEQFEKLVEKKLARFDNIFGKDTPANVKVTIEKHCQNLEITIHHKSIIYRAEGKSEDINKSLDIALNLISKNIEKHKTKLARSRHLDILDFIEYQEDNLEDKNEEYKITKRKTFTVKPLSTEEAILQMNLLGHHFFIFRNQNTNEINLIYRRKNETYGLIEPGN